VNQAATDAKPHKRHDFPPLKGWLNTRRSPGRAFKLAQGRVRPIGGLGTQERVAVGADRGKPWLENFLTSWFEKPGRCCESVAA